MLFIRKHSSTSNRFRVTLRHATTGQGLTGLDHTSSGLVIALTADNEASATAYTVAAGNVETVSSLGTYQAPTAGKCRFKAVDATNHPGDYELHFSDSRFAVAGAELLKLTISGAANLIGYSATIQLSDAVRGVGSPTAIPNADAATVGGLPVRQANGAVLADAGYWAGTAVSTSAGRPLVEAFRVANDVLGKVLGGGSGTITGTGARAVDHAGASLHTAAQQTADVSDLLTAIGNVPGLNWAHGSRTLTGFGTLVADIWSAGTRTLTALPGSIAADVTSILGKLAGITSVAAWWRAFARKSAPDATAISEINTGGGTFNPPDDALEALRDRGDAAWTTGAAAPTAGQVADAVWDEAIADHQAAGTTGNKLNAAGNAGDPWSTPVPGAYAAGTAGHAVGTYLDAKVSEAGGAVITPLLATASNPRYSSRDLAPVAAGSAPADVLTVKDATGAAVNLAGHTLRLVAALVTDAGGDDVAATDDTLASSFKYETGGAGLSVGGAGSNQVTIQHDKDKTAAPGDYRYWLWDLTDAARPIVLTKGRLPVEAAAFDHT